VGLIVGDKRDSQEKVRHIFISSDSVIWE